MDIKREQTVSKIKISNYKSIGNEPITKHENTIIDGIHSQGFDFIPALDSRIKYLSGTNIDSTPDLSRHKHISSVNPNEKFIIHDLDGRKKVSVEEFPYRMICLLLIKDKLGNDYFGTGFFISERCVITAGHCVFFGKNWAKEIKVVPGANGSMPYGYSISNRYRSVEGWTIDGNEDFDHGAIILNDNVLFTKVNSCFGYKPFENETLIEISGYPMDKNGTQWKSEGSVKNSNNYRIFYELDTVKGNSGSPVFIKNGNNRIVVGVHTFGDIPNYSTRVNQEIINRWTEWSTL
jgi:glutamyl endopeptidase